MIAFTALSMTALAAFFGASAWAVAAGAAALLMVSLAWHEKSYTSFEVRSNRLAQTLLLSGSVLNAAMAAGAAFGLGQLFRLFWML
jgi:hypothetical protein